jgi:hypothetical protein
MDDALQHSKHLNEEFKRLYYIFNDKIKSLTQLLVVEDNVCLPRVKMAKARNLLQMCLEKRQVSSDFLQHMVCNDRDYNWVSLIRTYYKSGAVLEEQPEITDTTYGKLCICQGTASLNYGNEFQSTDSVPIIGADDMKRSYYCITSAIASCAPVLLSGAPLSGKATAFNYLAARLGRLTGMRRRTSHVRRTDIMVLGGTARY